MMSPRAYWLAVAFSALASAGYLLWCWHDQTMAQWQFIGTDVMRAQFKTDHAAAVAYALARVVLAMALLEWIPRRDREVKS